VINTSKPIKDVATAYGVGPETLRNWLVKYREANGGTEAELTVSERAGPSGDEGGLAGEAGVYGHCAQFLDWGCVFGGGSSAGM
jgi:transposase-like protein